MTNIDVGALQRERKTATRSRLLIAFEEIKDEILRDGFYSENGGKVTLKEIARRAGVGSATLRNVHHRETRDLLRESIATLSQSAAASKRAAKSVSRAKIAFFEDALKRVNAEAVRWRIELKALREENRELRDKLSRYTNGENVIAIRGREND